MSGETPNRVSPHVLFALAGLETGVLGGLAMCAWFLGSSALGGRSPWILPNLAASLLYGRTVLRSGFGVPSVAGAALIIMLAGVCGMLFGLAVQRHAGRTRVTLLGILAALVWYYLSEMFFWSRLGVLAGIQVAPPAVLIGHLAYGLVLGRYPGRLAAAQRHFTPEPAGTGTSGPEDAGETPSGSMLE